MSIMVPKPIHQRLMIAANVPDDEDHSWELFNNPVRLYTDEQNAQTVRFIRAQPIAEWQLTGYWTKFEFKVLELSRYHFAAPEGLSDGKFVMMLEGPTRGQIHSWSSPIWYDGFEAEIFWDWDYVEWDRDTHPPDEDSGSEGDAPESEEDVFEGNTDLTDSTESEV